MKAILIQYFDALISVTIGIITIAYARRQPALMQKDKKSWAARLNILGPLILLFGLIQLATSSLDLYTWKRVHTDDAKASVEFPAAFTSESNVASANGISVTTHTKKCLVPKRGIELRLSYSDLTAEEAGITLEQRVEFTKADFVQKGMKVLYCAQESSGISGMYHFVIEVPQSGERVNWKFALTQKSLYRILASSSSGFHDDPVIARFLNTFELDQAPAK